MNFFKQIIFLCGLAAFCAGGVFAQSAAQYVERGRDNYKNGDYTGAIINWHRAIAADAAVEGKLAPYLANAYAKRGAEYYLRKEYDRAISDFDASLKLNPDAKEIRQARSLAEKAGEEKEAAPPVAPVYTPPQPAENDKPKPVAAKPGPGRKAEAKAKSPESESDGNWWGAMLGLFFIGVIGVGIVRTILRALDWYRKRKARKAAVLPAGDAGPPPPQPRTDAPPAGVNALVLEGKYEEARAVIARKKTLDLADYAALLVINIKMGDFMRARLTASQISQELRDRSKEKTDYRLYLPLAKECREKGETELAHQLNQLAATVLLRDGSTREAPREFYDLALSFENGGETDLAITLYATLIETARLYRDEAVRLRRLKEKLPQGGDKPAAPPVVTPHKAANRQGAAFKTGSNIFGTVLGGRYELKGDLGEGGMGVVYEAWDRQLSRKAAVKRMHSWLKANAEAYAGFRREAQLVAKLRHPNIVGVQGIIEEGGEVFLVFDYVAGRSLSDIIDERKTLPLKDCKEIMKGVCAAVDYAHGEKVIHRDLKPSNIMLENGNYPLVMDFGLASELRDSMTRISHQTMSGTPAYMAPEQHDGIVKKESAIYALGVCLYEMLSGEMPFDRDYEKRKKLKDYRGVSGRVPWLPGGLDAVIDRALEPEPSQRFASALDFYDALRRF
ncbi:MAG: protein kinase [Elusimicrobia bacterium]|nr:MAG: protein kinase [Elusimicrobiota bacterium]KAF0157161.1 MAG: protein kinase [Elusimicrobiota bacterium]